MIWNIIGIRNVIGFILFFVIYFFSLKVGFFQQSAFFVFGIIGLIGAVFFIVRIVSNILKEMKKRNTE